MCKSSVSFNCILYLWFPKYSQLMKLTEWICCLDLTIKIIKLGVAAIANYNCRHIIKEFRDIMEKSQFRQWPTWSNINHLHLELRGILEVEDWNHMKCEKWNTEWWYFCGKPEKELKNLREESFYSHFTKWTVNKDMWPMYFYKLGRKIKEWPKDVNEAISYFHRTLTLQNLKSFLIKTGREKFKKLQLVFPEIRNWGYTIHEIMDKDHIMIPLNRKSYGSDSPSSDSISSISENSSSSSSS